MTIYEWKLLCRKAKNNSTYFQLIKSSYYSWRVNREFLPTFKDWISRCSFNDVEKWYNGYFEFFMKHVLHQKEEEYIMKHYVLTTDVEGHKHKFDITSKTERINKQKQF